MRFCTGLLFADLHLAHRARKLAAVPEPELPLLLLPVPGRPGADAELLCSFAAPTFDCRATSCAWCPPGKDLKRLEA
jgi:hypothetical protein